MICNLDVGNSRLKWRYEHSDEVCASANEEDFLRDCLQRGVDVVLAGCVTAADKHAPLWQALHQHAVTVRFARVLQEFQGLRIAYDDPQALGVDRWLAMIAARRRWPECNLVVISAGTAVTIDYVSACGQHLGGLIVAGVQTSAASLYSGTDRVGSREITLPKNWQPGRTTLNCVEHGYSALFRGFLTQAFESIEDFTSPKIIMTGGDAPLLAGLVDTVYELELVPALVLDGLTVALRS